MNSRMNCSQNGRKSAKDNDKEKARGSGISLCGEGEKWVVCDWMSGFNSINGNNMNEIENKRYQIWGYLLSTKALNFKNAKTKINGGGWKYLRWVSMWPWRVEGRRVRSSSGGVLFYLIGGTCVLLSRQLQFVFACLKDTLRVELGTQAHLGPHWEWWSIGYVNNKHRDKHGNHVGEGGRAPPESSENGARVWTIGLETDQAGRRLTLDFSNGRNNEDLVLHKH